MSQERGNPVSVVLVGISGMGFHYLNSLLEEFPAEAALLCAAVDPFPQRSGLYSELKKRGIPVFDSLNESAERGISSELTVISSPIHYHVPQSCQALRSGSHVLCEKPIGATIQEAELLMRTRNEAKRWVMIGYQWSTSDAIQSLKKDVMAGLLGRPVRLKTLCLWPRDEAYYRRSDWAGRKKDERGNWVLDSPANNAMAHYLHNLFYVLGEKVDRSAKPAEVTAELYRAYDIENYDSAACRIRTEQGTELLYYASHAVSKNLGPMFNFQFEEATVTYGENSDDIVARSIRGKEKHYGSPEAGHPLQKLFTAVDSVREPKPLLCGPEAASSQTLCINGIQESVAEVVPFPPSSLHWEEKERRCWVKGLDEALDECYQKGILPGEGSFPWAQKGRRVDLGEYRYFPGGVRPADGEDRKR